MESAEMTEDEKTHDLFDRTDHPPRDEFLALEDPDPPKYRGKMGPGEFRFLAHGSGGYHTLLEFLDYHPDLDFIEEEVSNIGRDLDDLGWDGKPFEGLQVIRCKYTGRVENQGFEFEDYVTSWREQSRRPACWRVGTDWLMRAVLVSHVALWGVLIAGVYHFFPFFG